MPRKIKRFYGQVNDRTHEEMQAMTPEQRRDAGIFTFAHGSTEQAAERACDRGLLSIEGLRLVQFAGMDLREALRRYPEFKVGQRVVKRDFREYTIHTIAKVKIPDSRFRDIEVTLEGDRFDTDRYELLTEGDIESDIDYRVERDPDLKADLLDRLRN